MTRTAGQAAGEGSLRERLGDILFDPDCRAGRWVNGILMACVLASVAAVMVDSVEHLGSRIRNLLRILEWLFTGLFSAEYALRLWSARERRRYALSFFGLVDLVSTLPSYLAIFLPAASAVHALRALRLLRIFRLLKLVSYQGEAGVILRALATSRRKILVFLYAILIMVTILGTAMYVVEGSDSGFTSIPVSIYWAIVTLTTVGYGDISPQTGLGQALAALVMLLGYSIIAVPTGIVTAEMRAAWRTSGDGRVCPGCGQGGHATEARHCFRCGAALAGGAAAGDAAPPRPGA